MKGGKTGVWIFALALLLAPGLGAQPASQGAQPTTIGLGTTPAGERYLVDSSGMTLYYYTKDKDGESVCTGNCLKAWPAFYTPTISVAPPLSASDFGTVSRADGSKQTSYRGWPLYYWARDAKAGETSGEGVGKAWYLIDPAKFPVASM